MKKLYITFAAATTLVTPLFVAATPALAITPVVDSAACTLPANPVKGVDGFFLICNGEFWQSCGFSPAPSACAILGQGGSSTSGTGTTNIPSTTLTVNMWPGDYNPADQVQILQRFLNKELGTSLPLTGFFGPLTLAATKQLQSKYSTLTYQKAGYNAPTGFVGQYTRDLINSKLAQ
ncbi:MAG: hypothetical protein JWN18_173 [Parcubacteria group bacterium]|nr:hypothetical protein [Parcubacteria group bacterium]